MLYLILIGRGVGIWIQKLSLQGDGMLGLCFRVTGQFCFRYYELLELIHPLTERIAWQPDVEITRSLPIRIGIGSKRNTSRFSSRLMNCADAFAAISTLRDLWTR